MEEAGYEMQENNVSEEDADSGTMHMQKNIEEIVKRCVREAMSNLRPSEQNDSEDTLDRIKHKEDEANRHLVKEHAKDQNEMEHEDKDVVFLKKQNNELHEYAVNSRNRIEELEQERDELMELLRNIKKSMKSRTTVNSFAGPDSNEFSDDGKIYRNGYSPYNLNSLLLK